MPPVQSADLVVPQLATLWPLGTSAVGSSAGQRSVLWRVRSSRFELRPKLRILRRSTPQARADGDAPNPNANRLPLRAAALVLAASTEADIEPVD